MLIDTVRLLLFPTVMAFAASSDLLTMTISNRLSILLFTGFFALALVTGMSAPMLSDHVGAGLLVFAVTFFMFARGWIGGGDAKLASATALWLGFDQLLTYFLWASLFGGVLTYLLIRFRFMPLPDCLAGEEWLARLHRMDAGVPYGIALAAAALIVYPDTAFMAAPAP
jgi:prepilin peptidase CpaA